MFDQIQLSFGYPIVILKNVITEEYRLQMLDNIIKYHDEREVPENRWDCDVYTTHSITDLSEDNLFHPFLQMQLNYVLELAKKVTNNNIKKSSLINSWFNVYTKGQYQETHIHQNCHFSTIYYLKAPEGSSKTGFVRPGELMTPIGAYYENNIYIEPEEGTMLIFPSSVPHFVHKHNLDERRITIASNFSVSDEE